MWKILLALLLVTGPGSAGAQELKVAEEELRGGSYAGIEFQNYTGAHADVESAEAIRAIGLLLAADLERGGAAGRYALKYSVLRAADPSRAEGLDADVFSIDREARVDHVDNIRRIVAAYLEAAWGYSPADARLLAGFVTLYNAVHRGDLDYFGGRYKPVVLGHLTRRNAGLSTRYAEWPGATRMLIPLAAPARKGSLAALGADELTSKGVIGQLRSRPDRGLEPRKEMVELKERQVAEEKAGLEERRGELETRREEQARQERALQEERRAQEAREEQAATPQEKEEAARGRRELETREAELAAQRAETARQETEAAGRAEAVAGRERALEAERQGIVRDERGHPFQPAAAAAAGPAEAPGYYSDKLYYLWARGNGPDGLPLRALSVLDPFTAGVHRTSPVTGIVSPAYIFFQGGILVAARPAPGQAGGPAPASAARLVLLHPATLEPLRWSEAEVHPQGMVFLQGESLYTVVRRDGDWKLGRFDGRLALAASSAEAVRPDGFLAAFGPRLYATDPRGRVLALDGQSLARQALIEQP